VTYSAVESSTQFLSTLLAYRQKFSWRQHSVGLCRRAASRTIKTPSHSAHRHGMSGMNYLQKGTTVTSVDGVSNQALSHSFSVVPTRNRCHHRELCLKSTVKIYWFVNQSLIKVFLKPTWNHLEVTPLPRHWSLSSLSSISDKLNPAISIDAANFPAYARSMCSPLRCSTDKMHEIYLITVES